MIAKTKPEYKSLDYYLGLKWTYTLETRDDADLYYVIRVNELPGVVSDGETVQEALDSVKDAIASMVKSKMQHNEPIPEPINREQYKGVFSVRTTPEKHYRLAHFSDLKGRSMNSLLDDAIDKILAQA